MFWKRLLHRKSSKTPENTRLYAIGDIHGCYDLLLNMHRTIQKDMVSFNGRKVLIFLGDYVDRGDKSKDVVEWLSHYQEKDVEVIFLKGNHELAMQHFLQDPETFDGWLYWGGEATLESYGVKARDHYHNKLPLTTIAHRLNEALPDTHKAFLNNLKTYHTEKEYIFVHAGLKPGVPLAQQKEDDMMMIREEFFLSRQTFEKIVVFGHTIFSEPLCSSDRIGIDTGAYSSGVLSCVVLEGNDVRFLSVKHE